MKIKVAQYIADFLVEYGIEHNFTVTGGGAMHMSKLVQLRQRRILD